MDLSHLRDRIDAVDRQIIALLAERLGIVEEVALAKLEAASPFRDREREQLLLVRLREHAAAAGLDPHQVERLYRVVMDMSVAHQEATVRNRPDAPLRIAYQGVEGSYSHLAAQRRYGHRERRRAARRATTRSAQRRRRGADRRRRPRAPADREHDGGQHQRDLRPARGRRAAHHRRGGERDRALPARAARSRARRAAHDDARIRRRSRSARASSRRIPTSPRAPSSTPRARRVASPSSAIARTARSPRRRRRRRYGLAVLASGDPDRGWQRDPVRRDRAASRAAGGRGRGEDLARAGAGRSARRARRDPDAVRGARAVADQARVPADPERAVHLSVLRRRARARRERAVRPAIADVAGLTTELRILGTYPVAG